MKRTERRGMQLFQAIKVCGLACLIPCALLAYGTAAQALTYSEGLEAHGVSADPADSDNSAGVTIAVIAPAVGAGKLEELETLSEIPVVTVLDPANSQVASGDSDVGLDMLQIIHDMAPSASLIFVSPAATDSVINPVPAACAGVADGLTYNDSADGLDKYTQAGAFLCALDAVLGESPDIIVDALEPIERAPFHDGPVALAVQNIANSTTYVIAAGEEGSVEDAIGSTYRSNTVYESGFNGVSLPQEMSLGAGFEYIEQVHSFDGTTAYLTIQEDLDEVCLYWADQPGAAVNDYELFAIGALTDAQPNLVLGQSANFQYFGGDQTGEECITDDAALVTGKRLVVGADAIAAQNRFLHIRGKAIDSAAGLTNPFFDMTTGGAIVGRAGLANVITVGAAPAPELQGVYRSFEVGDAVTELSSAGDRTVFYDYSLAGGYVVTASGDDTLPAAERLNTPAGAQVRVKPEVAGAEEVGVTRISGTTGSFSAAAGTAYGSPVAAAHIAGLIARTQSSAGLFPLEVYDALIAGAVNIGLTDGDTDAASGYGAPLAADIKAALALPMPPLNVVVAMIDVATAQLTFSGSPDDIGFRYDAQCSQISDADGSSIALPTFSDISSGFTFTVTPGYTPRCSLIAYDGPLQSSAVDATLDTSGSIDTTLVAPTLGTVRNEPEGFVAPFTVDDALPEDAYAGTLLCTTGAASTLMTVVDESVSVRIPNATASAYDLEPNVEVACTLTITATVNGVVVAGAGGSLSFTALPEEALATGLPIWLLYEASKSAP